ncbi:MAG: glycosyltransferase family 2 protein, partial [Chitinophagaceae bacterium]
MQLSILIRNLNEAGALRQTLLSLKRQESGGLQYEVIIVDNESDDNSLEVAEELGCTVITMKRNEFTFGHALNVGISHCAGEFILVMSAHIILLNEFF